MKTFIAAAFVSLGAVLASPTSTALPALPAGDGLYVGRLDETGAFSWLMMESSVQDASAQASAPDAASDLAKRGQVYCNGFAAGSVADVNAAVAAITSGCHDTYFSNAIAFQRGDVVVYGCAFGHGERCNGFGLGPIFSSIAAGCGPGNAGWYDLPEYDARFGYTRAGNGFC